MKKIYKPAADREFGGEKRSAEIKYINSIFEERNCGCKFVSDSGNLHFPLIGPDPDKEAFFIIAYQGHGGVFITVPKELRSVPKKYIKELAQDNYYMLIVGQDSTDTIRKYSFPTSLRLVEQTWSGAMGKDSNDHKYIFQGKLTKIGYTTLEDEGGLQPSILKFLISLVS